MATTNTSMPNAGGANKSVPNMSVPNAEIHALDSVHQLKDLLLSDPGFTQSLRASASTDLASKLAAERGFTITPKALWRHRGTLASGGLPTWRG